ncbi:glycosyltransferase family 1 protein [Dyella sp. M7H15-1]|uniref:glycosyltransferase family 4 protein n=1 Tax=Dyella sp. M7H15-1 TaxID=2501295 RepID=UPI0013E89F79|nr:glycosyltransferase family 1 protein [Dyella sp. M7H15-1]
MKLLLDLQGAQSQSRHRGIGRYTLALTHAFLERAEPLHDVRLLFNARFDAPTDALIATLGRHARPDRRVLLDMPEGIRAQPGGNAWLRQAASRIMRHAIEGLHADVAWFSSPLEGYNDDAVLPDAPPAGMASVATLYDLIPLHDADAYLGHPRVREWYEQGVDMLRRCDLLLAISEWVRQDAIERLHLPPERVVNIGSAVDGSFRRPDPNPAASEELRRRHGIVRPFVLYNGGFDPRKNVAALIEAFATLPKPLRSRHQLVIVGRISDEEKLRLDAVTRRTTLPPGSIVYTGFAPDSDLIRLYAECALFVFPSLLEGFGLPPLEAMACGAPVIASNSASLPEVIDRRDALFDPKRVESISERMTKVLDNPAFATELRQYALDRAASFRWSTVAQRAGEAMQALAGKRQSTHIPTTSTPTSRITCVRVGGARAPAWLSEHDARIVSLTSQAENSDVMSWPQNSERVLYVANASNLQQLEPIMRSRPGALLIEELPQNLLATPGTSVLRAAYRAGGYAKLVAMRDVDKEQADPRLISILEHSLGTMCTDERIPHALRAQATAITMPNIAVLPAHNASYACIQQMALAYSTHPLALEAQLLDDIAAMEGKPSDDDIAAVASAVVTSRKPGDVRQWLVDVSSIAEKDIRTGVQRVVRNILVHWLKSPPAGIRIEPVRFSQGRYRYARRYALDLLGATDVTMPEDAVEIASGDVFVGLDWAIDTIAAAEPQLRDWHRRGVSMHFLVHDLLPITLPDTFHPYARNRFEDWLRRIIGIGDQFICVSQATATDLHHWINAEAPTYPFGAAPIITHSPLGVDAMLGNNTSEPRKHLAKAMHARPTLLMVGTIEPRKGYDQALEACEILWNNHINFNLVIVGHFGWLMETFRARVEGHAEHHQRLFWLDDVCDDELDVIYRTSTTLLAASWGEGYGLPLIEAARRGLPVIARDLPVFREVMGEQAQYFTAPSAEQLADVLRSGLTRATVSSDRVTPPMQWSSWKQSAAAMAHKVMAHRP